MNVQKKKNSADGDDYIMLLATRQMSREKNEAGDNKTSNLDQCRFFLQSICEDTEDEEIHRRC